MYRETQGQEALSSPNLARRLKIAKVLAGVALAVAVVKDGANIGEALFMPAVEFTATPPAAESVVQSMPGQGSSIVAAIDRYDTSKQSERPQDLQQHDVQRIFEEMGGGIDMPEEERSAIPADGGHVDAGQFPDKSKAMTSA